MTLWPWIRGTHIKCGFPLQCCGTNLRWRLGMMGLHVSKANLSQWFEHKWRACCMLGSPAQMWHNRSAIGLVFLTDWALWFPQGQGLSLHSGTPEGPIRWEVHCCYWRDAHPSWGGQEYHDHWVNAGTGSTPQAERVCLCSTTIAGTNIRD